MKIDFLKGKEKPEFVKEYESFCYQYCIKLILDYYGVKNSELFINSSLCLNLKYDEDNMKLNLFASKGARDLLPSFSSKIDRYYYKDNSYQEIWEINKESINQNMPIIVGADLYYLPYLDYYQKTHGSHTMILTGYDDKNVSIVDWYLPWFYMGDLNFQEYFKSRDSKNPYDGNINSGNPILNNWTRIDSIGWEISKDELLGEIVDLSISQYFDKVSDDNLFNGIYALKEIDNYISKVSNYENNDFCKCLKNLYYQIYPLLKRHSFFLYYLASISKTLSLRELETCIKSISKSAADWETWLLLLLKGTMKKSERLVNIIKESLSTAVKNDENLYNDLVLLKSRIN